MNKLESYEYPPGSNGSFAGKQNRADVIQHTLSSCPDCYSIQQANKNRTQYDLYWIHLYNTRAQRTDTNLLNLQFAS